AIMAFHNVFFVSDLHFSDDNVFYYYRRNYFYSTLEMNDKILLNWNSKVSENSLTFILGDIVPNKDVYLANHFLKNLNGYKIIVNGNHDPKEFSTPKIISLTYDSLTLILVHVLGDVSNNHKNRNIYYLHGHTHNINNLSNDKIREYLMERLLSKRSINVNLEFHDYLPLEIQDILKMIGELNKCSFI
ncbi:MAG: metallophosphoesterase, partial [Candidatus Anstonellales archaeon]